MTNPGWCVGSHGGYENKCKTCAYNMANLAIEDDVYDSERYIYIESDVCRIIQPYWSQWNDKTNNRD